MTHAELIRHYAAVHARLVPPAPRIRFVPPDRALRVPTILRLNAQPTREERVAAVLRAVACARPVTPGAIIRETAIAFEVNEDDITGYSRADKHLVPRMIAIAICRLKLGHNHRGSYVRIGEAFGGRDHSTVINAVQKYRALVARAAKTLEKPE